MPQGNSSSLQAALLRPHMGGPTRPHYPKTGSLSLHIQYPHLAPKRAQRYFPQSCRIIHCRHSPRPKRGLFSLPTLVLAALQLSNSPPGELEPFLSTNTKCRFRSTGFLIRPFLKIFEALLQLKKTRPKKRSSLKIHSSYSKNLWKTLLNDERRLNDISQKELQTLAQKLHADIYQVDGKTTHKEEFVTCGGVILKEVEFKTMESNICPGLYFAGEILDIDGVTGGFNFQAAWTTGFIAGSSAMQNDSIGRISIWAKVMA